MVIYKDDEKKIAIDDVFDECLIEYLEYITEISEEKFETLAPYIIGFLESKEIDIYETKMNYWHRLQRKNSRSDSPISKDYGIINQAIDKIFTYSIEEIDEDLVNDITNYIQQDSDDIQIFGVLFESINYDYPYIKGAFITYNEEENSISMGFWGTFM